MVKDRVNIPRLLFRGLLGRRLPLTEGTLEVLGIRQPVLIRRDKYGIPYIEAQHDEDAWYALGFCQGQDRAFQIEIRCRAVRGTLSALIGPDTLPIDRLARQLGLYDVSKRQLEVCDPETLRMLEAFTRGVSDGATLGSPHLAHEFVLLGAAPTPYRPADALGGLKLLSIAMPSKWGAELARLKVLLEDGAEALKALDPAYPDWLPVISPPGALAGPALDRLMEDLTLFMEAVGPGAGSNNWVLDATRTATGRPLLANDPHLSPDLPPHWYLAHIRTPEWAAAGACLVGTPAFTIGHNETSAWGVTAGLVDHADVFVEELGPDRRSVRQDNLQGQTRFIPCEVREEVIEIKGQEPWVEEVLVTPRGPIIGGALAGHIDDDLEALAPGSTYALSLSAMWLERRPIGGFLQLHRDLVVKEGEGAEMFEAFRHVFEAWPALPLSVVYADSEGKGASSDFPPPGGDKRGGMTPSPSGTIGWQLVGDVPQRYKGWGTLPLPGWDPSVGWKKDGESVSAQVPFETIPYAVNPEAGFIATANNKPLQDGQGPFLGVDWVDGYRLTRIAEVLEPRYDWDIKAMQRLQMDQVSIPWRVLREIVLALSDGATMHVDLDEAAQEALALLAAWDGVVTVDSPAATVFELLASEMLGRIVKAKAPRSADWVLGKRFTPLLSNTFSLRYMGLLLRLVREQPAGWFDRSWPEELADALATVMGRLKQRYGDDTRYWTWGHVRSLTLTHPVGERHPLLGRIFNVGPFPWGGDTYTVGQSTVYPNAPLANPGAIASLRIVMDVGDWERTEVILPGGQSGNPLSPHYADMLPLWRRGEGVPLAWSQDAVTRLATETLQLLPR